MLKVRKKHGKVVKAYRLGSNHPVLENLIKEKKLIDLHNGKYEVFSQEVLKSESNHGQIAYEGDWIRIDGAGYPYPNKAAWFNENLVHIHNDDYEQIPKVLNAWTADSEPCPEIQFLLDQHKLVLNETNEDKYFNATLWGAQESAAKNAVLVFYNIAYDVDGSIQDIEFNFVEKNEFDRTYDVV